MATAAFTTVEESFNNLRTKYRKSVGIFIGLTVLTFLIVAATLILSIWAVKVGNPNARTWFIGIAILTAIIAFLNLLISTFTFGVNARKAKDKLARISLEEKTFNASEGEYTKLTDTKEKLEVYIRRVTLIYNE